MARVGNGHFGFQADYGYGCGGLTDPHRASRVLKRFSWEAPETTVRGSAPPVEERQTIAEEEAKRRAYYQANRPDQFDRSRNRRGSAWHKGI